MLTRLIDIFKSRAITALFTSLTPGSHVSDGSVVGVSSLMDAWLLLRNEETNGEGNRTLYILKSRGMAHSNQVREFLLTDKGMQILDVYTGPSGVLTGSARKAQEAQDSAAELERKHEIQRRQLALQRERAQLDSQIATLKSDFESEERELERTVRQLQRRQIRIASERQEMAHARQADAFAIHGNGRK